MKLQAILEPSNEGGYTVFVPGISGCISEGDTEDQALTNIREAIELYFEPIDDDNISCNEGARKVELVI